MDKFAGIKEIWEGAKNFGRKVVGSPYRKNADMARSNLLKVQDEMLAGPLAAAQGEAENVAKMYNHAKRRYPAASADLIKKNLKDKLNNLTNLREMDAGFEVQLARLHPDAINKAILKARLQAGGGALALAGGGVGTAALLKKKNRED